MKHVEIFAHICRKSHLQNNETIKTVSWLLVSKRFTWCRRDLAARVTD